MRIMIRNGRRATMDLWLLFIAAVYEVASLQIEHLQVPVQVLSGSDVVLRCLYSTADTADATPLYSLKWYKGSHEFFSHLPQQNPPTKVFPWADFRIDVDGTEPGRVMLRDVSAYAEGTYKCEVSSEGPTFNTDFAVANLTVFDVVQEKMALVHDIDDDKAKKHGRQKIRCTFSKSRPPVHISWLVNGKQVTASRRVIKDDPATSLSTVESTVEVDAKNGVNATCIASLGGLYKKTSALHIHPEVSGTTDPSAVAVAVGRKQSMANVVGSHSGNSGTSSDSSFDSSAQIFLLFNFFSFFFFSY